MEQINGIIDVGTASLDTQSCRAGTQDWHPISDLFRKEAAST